MSIDQAEAITRKLPYLHHLVLPRGVIDLEKNIPTQDVDLIGPTATLLIKDNLHPALIYLLLKVASQVHGESEIFEKKGEFPENKDYQFALNDDAKEFYKSGTPFWHRYLPFWIATLVQRFIFLVIPTIAVVLPVLRLIPQFQQWQIKNKIYKCYGELKVLENEIPLTATHAEAQIFFKRLDEIEQKVRNMKIPLQHSESLYGLRSNIQFVKTRINLSEGTP